MSEDSQEMSSHVLWIIIIVVVLVVAGTIFWLAGRGEKASFTMLEGIINIINTKIIPKQIT